MLNVIFMGYKKDLKYRVIDMLQFKHRNDDVRATFVLIDSAKDGYFGIMLDNRDVGYFIRHAGTYGMIYEKSLCEKVGSSTPLVFQTFDVHIVESKDEAKSNKNKK